MTELQMQPDENMLQLVNYEAYLKARWRPWAFALVITYNVTTAIIIMVNLGFNGDQFDVLDTITRTSPWIFGFQMTSLFLFIRFSTGMDHLLKGSAIAACPYMSQAFNLFLSLLFLALASIYVFYIHPDFESSLI